MNHSITTGGNPMKAVYPIVMTKCNREYYPYYIDIPDFNCLLHADDPYTGMKQARKKIYDQIKELKSYNQPIPPSNFVIPTNHYSDVITLIDIDTDEFEKEQKTRNFFKFLTVSE